MPMTFPDLESLAYRAKMRGFRQPLEDESEEVYRAAFADFMQSIDMVEAGEIRLGRMPMDFVREADPMSALAAIMGKSRNETSDFMNDFFGSK